MEPKDKQVIKEKFLDSHGQLLPEHEFLIDHDWGWVVYIEFPTGQISFHVVEDSRHT